MDDPRRTEPDAEQALTDPQRFALLRGGLLEPAPREELQETLARYRAVLDAAFDAIVTMDHEGRVVDFNRSAEQMFGHVRADVIGRTVADLIVPPDLRQAHQRGLERHLRTGAATVLGHPVQLRALRADGTEFDAELAINRTELPSGPLFTASIRDISERTAIERELREAEHRYRSLVEQLPLVVYIDEASEGSPNLYTSPQTTEILGYTPEDWRADPNLLERILHPDDRDRVLADVTMDLSRDKLYRSEYRLIAKDGRTVWVRDEAAVIRDSEGTAQWQGYLLDVTAEREARAELERLAFADPLTGLANRATLERVIRERHVAAEHPLTLLYLDLDDFKTVNDSLGHAVGDELLTIVATRLRRIVRDADVVARIGGDEFALLVHDADPASIARRVVASLEQPITTAGHEFVVGASVGIAVGSEPDEIMRHADMAMYDAKSAGGGVYRFFEEGMHEAAVKRLELLGELSRPSFADEMFLEYQPIFGLDSRSLIAVEALCRWRHPRRGLVSPQDFIGLAEETGRIIEIGRIILATACAQAAEWTGRFQRRLQISVNVSARQLADPSFADDVTATLAASGLEANLLVLELTESALMTGDAVAARNLEHLRERGIRIAIDDFGTGYSSLAYLAKLAIDAIKIDRSFVDECDRTAEGMRMIETITTLGHSLGLNVVAEGIERETQLRALSAAGCDALQGFLLARPLPAEALGQLLVGPELSWLSS